MIRWTPGLTEVARDAEFDAAYGPRLEPGAADPVTKTVLSHVSTRSYRPHPIPEAFLDLLCEAMRRAPSSSALQTRTFVLITDPDVRESVRLFAGGQSCIAECSVFIVGCIDLRIVDGAVAERGYENRSGDLRLLITATEDVAIAQQNASLTAQSLGWGTVMIGGVLNGTRQIAQLLGLPPRVIPVLGLCVGHSADPLQALRPRLPLSLVFHRDRFNFDADREARLLAEHDREVVERGYYDGRRIGWREIGGVGCDPVPDAEYGWAEHVARKHARLWWERATPDLVADLRALGWRGFP